MTHMKLHLIMTYTKLHFDRLACVMVCFMSYTSDGHGLED